MADGESGARTGLMAAILPPAAVAVEAFADDPGAVLFPAEEALLARAVGKRRREFTTGRACAHRALAGLGVTPAPLLPGPDREPLWPDGVVGSITHCDGYRAAVVAFASDLASVGVDAEPNGPMPEGVLERVALAAERDQVAALGARTPQVHWDRLLFCAKESVYKTWFPLAHRWLGFEDAEVTINPAAAPPGRTALTGTFTARLLVEGPRVAGGHPLSVLAGRYLVDHGLVVTAIAMEVPS